MHSYRERVKNFMLYGDVTKDEYTSIKLKIERANRLASTKFSVIATILIFIMYLLSYVQEGFKSSRSVYTTGVLASLVLVVMAFHSKRVPLFTYVLVYASTFIFLSYGIAIGVFTRAEETTVTFMVLLILVPTLFVDRPIRMAGNLFVYIVVFISLALRYKKEPTLSVDITDAIIFGALSIASTCIIYRAKIKGFLLETELQALSETDSLTGLNNRNSYEWRVKAYKDIYSRSICCIYIDVNGLHEINNAKGHTAGDKMLCEVADIVQRYFGNRHSYRIGGDEFVVFVFDVSLADINKRIERTKQEIADKKYHVAIGHDFSSERISDISPLIASAELNMYKNKDEYYKKYGRQARK